MDLDKVVKIRKWNNERNSDVVTFIKISKFIEEPWLLNLADIGEILLNELRSEKGLGLLPGTEHFYGETK